MHNRSFPPPPKPKNLSQSMRPRSIVSDGKMTFPEFRNRFIRITRARPRDPKKLIRFPLTGFTVSPNEPGWSPAPLSPGIFGVEKPMWEEHDRRMTISRGRRLDPSTAGLINAPRRRCRSRARTSRTVCEVRERLMSSKNLRQR